MGLFRVVRDLDIEFAEEADDLIRVFEAALKERRLGSVIRLEVDAAMPPLIRDLISRELRVDAHEVVIQDGILGLSGLTQLIGVDRPDLKFPPAVPRFPERIRQFGGDCFSAIRAKDIIVHANGANSRASDVGFMRGLAG
jgi:polyphosphate kinase